MDTIGDFLTRIRNAQMAGHEKVDVPSSNLRTGIVNVLRDEGFVRNYKVVRDGKQGMMRVYLKYDRDAKPVIEMIRRVSKPSRRVYVGAEEVPKVRSGYGLAIISTSKGVMSGVSARKEKVGGEVLLEVW